MASQDIQVASPVPHHLSTRSPRSSMDSSPRTPNSPFLQSLSNRFRKGSNASNVSTHLDPPQQPADSTEKPETAQSAKRFVLSVIRNDWEWPPPQPATVSGGENVTTDEKKQESVISQREPVGWRTRFEGASDLDLESSPVTAPNRKKSKRNSDPYKFESPDAIATVIQEQRMKRRRANAEEAVWNEGLRTWTERRDAWTAAEPHNPKKRSFAETEGHRRSLSSARIQQKGSRSSDDSKHSQSSRVSNSPTINAVNGEAGHDNPVTRDSDLNENTEDESLHGPYLPIYPPLFPTSHTLRSRIKPAAYPTIYSKVVLQSLTPNVPIPLTHMIGALVDGWKAEGNWPPQTLAEQHQHALLKRAKGSTKGETAFQKWRRERDVEKRQEQMIFGDEFADDVVHEEEEKKGFRHSISGAVRKVLGIHAEEEEDGGLAKLGLHFGVHNESDNMVLNPAEA